MIQQLWRGLLAALLAVFAAAAFAAVDVNTASQADLDGIKGIGPAIAGKIVTERGKGLFKDWQDLITRVKGVGEKNAATFSTAGLTVNGAGFAGAPPAAAAPATTKAKAPPSAMATTAPTAPAAPAVPMAKPMPAPATAAAPAAASAPMSAADKKAAARAAREEKKAAKAASAADAKDARAAKKAGAASAAR